MTAPVDEQRRQEPPRKWSARSWWPWAKRLLNLGFFALVGYLLVSQARQVEWEQVFATMGQRSVGAIAAAVSFAVASFALYSCFDLLGRHYSGHRLPWWQAVIVNFISYAFNLNMGSLIGGVGFRYRLYSRLGLNGDTITRVVAISMMTNWLGYVLLAGLAFWWWPIALPPDWGIGESLLRWLGFILFCIAATYIVLCSLQSAGRRGTVTIRGHGVPIPSLPFSLLQLLMSCVNWSLMAAAMTMLLDQKVPFPVVLQVLLVAAIAGVITHVPAGLGVLEAVFVALLSHMMARHELLAALLTYRAIYYLAPLALATALYLVVEARSRKMSTKSAPGNS